MNVFDIHKIDFTIFIPLCVFKTFSIHSVCNGIDIWPGIINIQIRLLDSSIHAFIIIRISHISEKQLIFRASVLIQSRLGLTTSAKNSSCLGIIESNGWKSFLCSESWWSLDSLIRNFGRDKQHFRIGRANSEISVINYTICMIWRWIWGSILIKWLKINLLSLKFSLYIIDFPSLIFIFELSSCRFSIFKSEKVFLFVWEGINMQILKQIMGIICRFFN